MNAKILIVDDDPDIVMMLRTGSMLPDTRLSPPPRNEALDHIVHESPQLVLLDLTAQSVGT